MKNLFLLILLLVAILVPRISGHIAQADSTSPGGDQAGKLENPLAASHINSIEDLIPKLLAIVVQVGIVICTLFIIRAGFLYVTAGGDPGKIEKAHTTFLWAVVGTAVLLGAQVISTLLSNTVKSVLGK